MSGGGGGSALALISKTTAYQRNAYSVEIQQSRCQKLSAYESIVGHHICSCQYFLQGFDLFSDCCKFISGDGTSKMPVSSRDFPSAEKKEQLLLITCHPTANLWMISKAGLSITCHYSLYQVQ
jgi:hypothetical protein